LTTGSRNTFVGAYNGSNGSGRQITTGSANTILGGYDGNQGGLDIRTSSNCIVLSDGDGNPRYSTAGANSDHDFNIASAGGNCTLRLSRAGTPRWFLWNDGTTNRLNITPASFASGVYLTDTATSWTAYSDRRIKTAIVDLDLGLSAVMSMQPRRYTFTATGVEDIGFVAQELKQVLPEAVVGEELEIFETDTAQERAKKLLGVSKETIIPVLVKAIQELNAKVEAQAAEIAALKGQS